ncbi:hypothetical protein H4Q26_013636 [Puccinia striiformis f. sp. tritici PST-130]|nr:hypothetical protein H4Q26_013636 [Puccinia striiformis f. sp. tritici PST-130]
MALKGTPYPLIQQLTTLPANPQLYHSPSSNDQPRVSTAYNELPSIPDPQSIRLTSYKDVLHARIYHRPCGVPISLFAQQADNVTCFGTQYTGLDVNHCRRALRNIVYDSNGRLDSYSSTVFTCTKLASSMSKRSKRTNRLDNGSKLQFSHCSNLPPIGIRKYPDGTQAQVYRSTATNVYDVNQPVCRKRTCNFQPNDCLLALNQLSVDPKGNFMGQKAATPVSQATWGNCTVLMQTTDSSAFRISHQKLTLPSSPGSVYISGGTEGSNGDVRLSTLGSKC